MHKTVTKMADRETKPSMTSLRMTDKLRLKLIQSASASGRSLNAEITSLLEQAVFEQSIEAMLRRVVREEIAADKDATKAAQIARFNGCVDRIYDPVKRQFTEYVPDTRLADRTGHVVRQTQDSYDAQAAKALGDTMVGF